jgi:uncharacterized protein
MPVRSLSSSVLTWPDRQTIDRAVWAWADKVAAQRPDLVRVGYFGSYARGDWGPGSDLDLIVVVKSDHEAFSRRSAKWDTTNLPVPADLLVYTVEEWRRLDPNSLFSRTLSREAVWVYEKEL